MWREGTSVFQASGQGGRDYGAKMCFHRMHDRYGPSIKRVRFWDRDTGGAFGSRGSNATDETEVDESVVEVCKRAREAGKKMNLEVVVTTGKWNGRDVSEELVIRVRTLECGIREEAERPIQSFMCLFGLEEVAHAIMGVNNELCYGRGKWF